MDPKNIEEAGCAVCGLLKPSCELSRLKNVKNFLHILQQEGVTRVERKTEDKKVHEYNGLFLITHAAKYVMTAVCLSEKEKSPVLHWQMDYGLVKCLMN